MWEVEAGRELPCQIVQQVVEVVIAVGYHVDLLASKVAVTVNKEPQLPRFVQVSVPFVVHVFPDLGINMRQTIFIFIKTNKQTNK